MKRKFGSKINSKAYEEPYPFIDNTLTGIPLLIELSVKYPLFFSKLVSDCKNNMYKQNSRGRFLNKTTECHVSFLSKDTKGRSQLRFKLMRSPRSNEEKRTIQKSVFAYHVMFVDSLSKDQKNILSKEEFFGNNHKIGKVYSHLCHNGNCINPSHGVLETNKDNLARNTCFNDAVIFLWKRTGTGSVFEYKKIDRCTHTPKCIKTFLLYDSSPIFEDKTF